MKVTVTLDSVKKANLYPRLMIEPDSQCIILVDGKTKFNNDLDGEVYTGGVIIHPGKYTHLKPMDFITEEFLFEERDFVDYAGQVTLQND